MYLPCRTAKRRCILWVRAYAHCPTPMPTFEFATAARILFGEGSLQQVPAAAASMGRRALLVTGASPDRAAPLRTALHSAGVSTVPFSVPGEPTLSLIRSAPRDYDFVIAFGGGSVLDAAKALAALLTNPGDPLDYLEVIGLGHPLAAPAAPCIAIPTTAGTGSEVTRNAVLASPERPEIQVRKGDLHEPQSSCDGCLLLSRHGLRAEPGRPRHPALGKWRSRRTGHGGS